jgi:hypothetical protein
VGTVSIIYWIIPLAVLATVIPIARILKRIGVSPWWAILYFVPLVNLVGLWMLAFSDWPRRGGAVEDQFS